MRVLEFIATGQALKCAPACDFSGIVAGSRGYLHARFHFSADWAGCKKVAVFTCKGKEYPVGIMQPGNLCEIPAEALTGGPVQVYVVGQRGAYRITTDEAAFTVRR
jgi:hypothetical protein